MKLAEAEVVLHSRGVNQSHEYSIAQSAKMMELLADGLYKDKIKAPIRELATNAWDAHVMAGTTDKVPIVHLPNYADPEFRIRDFGTGLSPEQLVDMYRIYGVSDKCHSNAYNGCMGLGSKAPFAYAHSFTTISYHNGTKYVYVNAKSETGIPTLNLFHSEPTSEPNGLQVSFAVKPSDFNDFATKAQQVLRWFPKKFKVEGGNGVFKWQDRTYLFEGDGWKVRDTSDDSYVVMGYVEYPIDLCHFSDDKSGNDRSNDWYKWYDKSPFTKILNLGVELHLDIGEVEMSISREGLQYTQSTINAIKTKLKQIEQEILGKVEARFKNCKTLWDARILLCELRTGKMGSVISNLAAPLFNGQRVSATVSLINDSLSFSVSRFEIGNYSKTKRTDNIGSIDAHKDLHFWLSDLERGNYAVIERVTKEVVQVYNSNPVRTGVDKPPRYVYLVKAKENCTINQALADFSALLGIDPALIKRCSNVPVLPRQKREQSRVNVFKFKKTLDGTGSYRHCSKRGSSQYWQESVIDFEKGGYYVEINQWQVVLPDDMKSESHMNSMDCHTIGKIIHGLEQLGLIVPDIIGIKTISVPKYKKGRGWTNFLHWAKTALETHIKNHNFAQRIADLAELSSNADATAKLHNIVEYSRSAKIENQQNPILILLDKIKTASIMNKQWKEKSEVIEDLCRILCVKIQQLASNLSTEIGDLLKQINEDYPVLSLVDTWSVRYDNKASCVVKMINLIDKFNSVVTNNNKKD